jgi:hypothetical protein
MERSATGGGGGQGRSGVLHYFSWIFPCCIPLQLRMKCDLTLWKNDRHRSEIVVYIWYTRTYLKLSFLFSAAISLTLQFAFLVVYYVETNAADCQYPLIRH